MPTNTSPIPSARWGENHRPLYDWVIENCPVPARPRQTESARLNLTYTVMSKRKLLQLVQEGHVSGWDDPRMPTVSGMRRRGYTPAAIRNFCHTIGITKFNGFTDVALLEYSVREDLNANAPRPHGRTQSPQGHYHHPAGKRGRNG